MNLRILDIFHRVKLIDLRVAMMWGVILMVESKVTLRFLIVDDGWISSEPMQMVVFLSVTRLCFEAAMKNSVLDSWSFSLLDDIQRLISMTQDESLKIAQAASPGVFGLKSDIKLSIVSINMILDTMPTNNFRNRLRVHGNCLGSDDRSLWDTKL